MNILNDLKMKPTYKIFTLGLLTLSGMTACNDLDTEIYGGYATTEQKKELTEKYPEKLVASLAGISATASQFASIYTEGNVQSDFGMPSLMLVLDSRGIDCSGINSGYNWYQDANGLSDATPTSRNSSYAWYYPYQIINAANTLLQTTGDTSDNEETMFFIAQAKAERAASYMHLAQTFQFTYLGHENAPCVPIVTDRNMEEVAIAGGNPRASVAEVYAQIMDDLNDAVDYLSRTPITADELLSSKPKRCASLATAYGLRARANLLMGRWQEAADDAQDAINAFDGQPMSMQEAAGPVLWSMDEPCVMWAFPINENDDCVQTGLCNWPSFMGSFCYGYTTLTPSKRFVNRALYDAIPDTDVRKGWFLDANGKSDNLTPSQQAFANARLAPYAQVKFAPYQDVLGVSTNACDIMRMRIEEMYLIKAEAQAMAGSPSVGAQTLTSFVQTYRDPSYTCSASTAEEVRDAVWFQRRVELWGEGISYFDIMRLKKPIDRRGGGWPSVWVYNIPAESPVMLFPIPNDEIQANSKITAAQNNPSSTQPQPVND